MYGKTKIFFYGAVIILGIWLGTKFFGNDDNITYITEKVQRQNIQKVVNAAGEVRAIQLVTVGAQVSGKSKPFTLRSDRL
ncbi:MAG: hypothetical protein ACLU99_05810 [Alphaproteobacteria bacterium]